MKLEIHGRPMILPLLDGKPHSENRYEVDVWIYIDSDDSIGQVILETVADSQENGHRFIEKLKECFANAAVLVEEL
jgi:hypothetical protein